MAIEIQMATPGYRTVVSEDDSDLAELSWFCQGSKQKHAARRNGRGYIQLAHIILERMTGSPIPVGLECDHINGDVLDNRRENLRLATRSENNRNRHGWGKYGRGVQYDKKHGKYLASIRLGSFDTPEEAQRAWIQAASLLRGQFVVGGDRLIR